MADEIVNLATFQFDTALLEKSLDSLQTKMFELKKEQEAYNTISKEAQKAANQLTEANLKLAAAGKENSKEYKDNANDIKTLNEAQQQNYKNSQNVATNMSRVRVEIGATNKQLMAYMTTEGQQISLMDAGNKALQTQVNNINQARASNTELLRVRNQLNPTIAAEAKLITDLNKKLDENNAFIKGNASEYEKQKIGIGDYKNAIKDAFGELGGFNGALGNAQKALSIVTPLFGNLKDEAFAAFNQIRNGTVTTDALGVSETTTSAATSLLATETAVLGGVQATTATTTENLSRVQVAAASATNIVSGSLKLLKVALISTGIGAIVVLLGSLVAYFTTTQAGADKLSSALEPLKAIFSGLLNVLSTLGGKLVDVFSNPKKAISDFANFIKQNLINRFTALGDIIEGIFTLDFSKVAESTVQAVTGVDNLVGKVQGAAQATAAFLAEAAKKGAEIDRINKQIAAGQLEYNRNQVAIGDEIDKQLLISKDTSRSFKERGAAAEAIIAITEKNGIQEANLVKLAQKKLELELALKGAKNLTNEDEQARIDLANKLDAAEDRGLNARLEQTRVLSGLKKEQQDQAKKESEEAIKRQQQELDFYIASQGTMKKSMSEQIDIDRETQRQQLEINKAEYKAKIKNKTEYETEILKINQDFAAKQAELAIQNANIEYDLFILNNQRKLKNGEYFSDELYNQELDRINLIAEAEAAQATKKLELGIINAQEYALAIAQIDADQLAKNDEAKANRETSEKERQAANLAVQDEANAERFDYDLALSLERFDRQAAAELEALRKKGGDTVALEKFQAKQRETIEETVQNNKIQLASQAFGNIATLLGEGSAAGKAAAIAQTTIDTYQSATAAYKALAGIPVYGPALGGIAAGVAIASGLANVKKIVSVKTDTGSKQEKPKYARGVIGLTGSGTSTSDSIPANLSVGESVINARSTAMFPDLLSSINQAGGGVGLNGNLSNSILQNDISGRADNSQMASMIAEAVAIGAERGTASGSQKGIRDLSTDRKIQANASF